MPVKKDLKTMLNNLPAEVKQRYTYAFPIAYNYQETITDEQGNQIPNPQNKTEFTAAMIARHMKDVVAQVENQMARDAVVLPTPVDTEL